MATKKLSVAFNFFGLAVDLIFHWVPGSFTFYNQKNIFGVVCP